MLGYNDNYIRAVCQLAAAHTNTQFIGADIGDDCITATYHRGAEPIVVTVSKQVLARGEFIKTLRDRINTTP